MTPTHLQRRAASSQRSGFTLLEVIIVMGLIATLIGLATLSFASLENTDPLTNLADKLTSMAKQANRAAIVQGRPIIIAFEKNSFQFTSANSSDSTVNLPEGTRINYQRWNGGTKFSPTKDLNWTFHPTGICEPLRFQFIADDGGTIEMSFNPLTGSVSEQVSYLKRR
jgi:type II secretion system protein H